ncbi:MAG: MOSC domain-containing protein [Rubrivivax sp.]|nr:MOSC domain-containing protein [Rubrivivax sp.]
MPARVVAVHCKGSHAFSKDSARRIQLLAGQGVAGDAHCGVTVKHRSRVARDPTQPNLRQVHLMHSELFAELARKGLQVLPGQLGENITTAGLPVLDLAQGTVLRIGTQALVRVTGLRNPCAQIEAFMPGLLAAVLDRTPQGQRVRKAGIMGIVLESGTVDPGDAITIEHIPHPAAPLQPV